MPLVRIDGCRIRDWKTFHTVFAEAFGFPAFYGRNLDAWIDCMSDLDDPAAGMTRVHGSASDPVVLIVDPVDTIPEEIRRSLVDAAAFVNWRRIEHREPAILILAFDTRR